MPLWIPIAFLAVLLWVIGNLIDKYLLEKLRRDEEDSGFGAYTLFVFSALFAVPTMLLALVMGAEITIPYVEILRGITVGILNGIYLLFYLHAAARTEISRIVPIFQLVPILAALFGWIFLKEILSLPQIIAGALVISGALLMAYERSKERFDLRSVVFMIIACIAIALQLVLFKITTFETNYWTSIFWSAIGLISFGFFVFLTNKNSQRHIKTIIAQRKYQLIGVNFCNEVLDSAAYLTFLFATTLGPIALVQTVNAYQPILLLVITAVLTKLGFDHVAEDISVKTLFQKILGVLLIGIGSALIYIPLLQT